MTLGQSKGGQPPDEVCEEEDAVLKDMARVIAEFHDNSRCASPDRALRTSEWTLVQTTWRCCPFHSGRTLIATKTCAAPRVEEPLLTCRPLMRLSKCLTWWVGFRAGMLEGVSTSYVLQ